MTFDESTLASFRSLLLQQEGLELKPYKDSVGKLTIGVGRNLDDVGISNEEAMLLLENDVNHTCLVLQVLPFIEKLTPARQVVILSMAFNMGISKLQEFKRMLSALKTGDYDSAANEMLSSVWASQVKRRAVDLAVMMKTGQF